MIKRILRLATVLAMRQVWASHKIVAMTVGRQQKAGAVTRGEMTSRGRKAQRACRDIGGTQTLSFARASRRSAEQGKPPQLMQKKSKEREVRVAKFTDDLDDIEAYLTTFERQMQVYKIEKERWTFKLAPQLLGQVQQAYASMDAKDSSDYGKLS